MKNYYLHPICKQGGWFLMLSKCLFQVPIQVHFYLSRDSGTLTWGQWLEQGVLKLGCPHTRSVAEVVYQILTTNSLQKPHYQWMSLVMEVTHLWYYPIKLKNYIIITDHVGSALVLSTKGLEKKECGFYSYEFDESMSLYCVKQLNNSVMILLSNCTRPFPLDSVERFSKAKKKFHNPKWWNCITMLWAE